MKPRTARSYGNVCVGVRVYANGTWLESEEFCYPHGVMKRRAYALFPDGTKHIVWCGIADTYFSVPAKPVRVNGLTIRGYIGADENGIVFHPHTNQ